MQAHEASPSTLLPLSPGEERPSMPIHWVQVYVAIVITASTSDELCTLSTDPALIAFD